MNPSDNNASHLENKKGIAELTIDPFHDGFAMVVWKKKA
jgi:diadenosine tetraphosphate (Ap4A) HIT family hydrolase